MMLVSVYPERFDTTPGVTDIDMESRKCLLKNERVLGSLQRYSYSNCYLECRQNVSARLCGCTPFYYPNHCK
jgi:Amiloride-sensitive sodium channel.